MKHYDKHIICMQDTFARARTRLRPSATIGYIVYVYTHIMSILRGGGGGGGGFHPVFFCET